MRIFSGISYFRGIQKLNELKNIVVRIELVIMPTLKIFQFLFSKILLKKICWTLCITRVNIDIGDNMFIIINTASKFLNFIIVKSARIRNTYILFRILHSVCTYRKQSTHCWCVTVCSLKCWLNIPITN